jgi:hypothetical protein
MSTADVESPLGQNGYGRAVSPTSTAAAWYCCCLVPLLLSDAYGGLPGSNPATLEKPKTEI